MAQDTLRTERTKAGLCYTCGDGRGPDGTKWHCRGCADEHNGRVRKHHHKGRHILDAIKVEAGCVDCGYNADPRALDFDHKDTSDKTFNLAKGQKYSMAVMMAEVAKCDVRCANCHRIKTWRN